MDEQTMLQASARLSQFFDDVAALSDEQVRRLRRVPRAKTTNHFALELHPDRLAAVSSGRWTRQHDVLAAEAHRCARAMAARRAPLGRRGVLARVLENAAMVVVTDICHSTVLPPELRTRLLAPWADVMNVSAGDGGFVAA